MRQKRSATLSFSAVQASFWMSLCIAISFAAVHLKALGFSNTGLGLTLAAGNILGTLAGPLLASLSEKRRLPTARLIWPLFGLRVLCLIALAFCSGPTLSAAVFYALYVAGMMAVNSLNLKFCVDAELRGLALDYGKARAAGSLAYVLISALLGVLVERRSYPVLIWAAATVLLLQAASTFWIGAELGGEPGAETASEAKTGVSLPALLRGEPRFALFLLGSVLLYFSHNAITNYMINIVRNLGGDTGTMGLVNAVMAMVEIPVMLFFSLLARRLRVSLLLKLSVAAFLAKALAFALARVSLRCTLRCCCRRRPLPCIPPQSCPMSAA